MKVRTINLKKILIYMCCFFLLLFPFNATIVGKIYPQYSLTYISIIISMLLLFIIVARKKINRIQLIVFFLTLIIACIEFFGNKYASPVKKFVYTPYLFLPIIVSMDKTIIDGFKFNIKLFAIEHLSVTYLALIFKSIYINYVLPFFDTIENSLTRSHYMDSGFNPGFTTHYSTNGMYMSIFCILFFAEFMEKKSKLNFVKLIISVIALLVVGKKGAVLFVLFSSVISFFLLNRAKLSKKIQYFITFTIFSFFAFYICSIFIPQVSIVYDRFSNTISNEGDLMTGRSNFYKLALNLWNNHILFGNGWGAFSNYYQIELVSKFKVPYLDAHNVYIQLLCETGIIGFLFITSLMILCLIGTYKCIKKYLKKNDSIIMFSFIYQIYFLLYCFSGNALYDAQCYVLYFVSIGIFLFYSIRKEKNYEEN